MHSANVVRFGALCTALLVGACGFSPSGQGNPGSGASSGTGATTGLGAFGGSSTGQGGLTGTGGGMQCAAVPRSSQKLPPDILIVLDRSGSMNQDPATGMNCNTAGCSKWDQTTMALNQVVMATDATVNWGLKLFGSGNGCTVNNTTEEAITEMNAADVVADIDAANPGSSTPTRAAMTAATTYLNTLTARPNPKFILLATDGLPNCPAMGNDQQASDATAAVQSVTDAAMAGFPTFVVGIATTTDPMADTTLTQMAMAGGYPRPGTPAYYPVASQQELVDALNAIVTIAASCIFPVPPPPTDDGTTSRGNISITGTDSTGNATTINEDPSNGWTYTGPDMSSIELHGTACQAVMAGAVMTVTIIFNCIVP